MSKEPLFRPDHVSRGQGARKGRGHPTYQHQPDCTLVSPSFGFYTGGAPLREDAPSTDYEITDFGFGFGFGIGLGHRHSFRIGLLRYVSVSCH